MAARTGSMEVVVPKGVKAGQLIEAKSPEGIPVQVEVPRGLKPGNRFTVEYPIAADITAGGESERICGFKIRDVLIAFFLFLFAIVITTGGDEYHSGERTVVVHTQTFSHHARTHAILIVLVICGVAYDWKDLGPTVAIQHGAIAGIVAWLFVIPATIFFGSLGPIFILTMAIMAWVVFTVALGPGGFVVGLLLICAVSVLLTFFAAALEGTFGTVLLFAIVFFALRLWTSTAVPQMQKVEKWPYTTQIDPKSREFKQQVDFFLACCDQWQHMFDFSLTVQNLYKINRPGMVMAHMANGNSDGTKQLFHGTGWEAAKAIICDGFKMPTTAGMFGKGLYFADCPLKSWRYCFPSRHHSKLIPRMTNRGGLIFMCRVDLGEVREETEAKPDMKGYKRGGWRDWWRGGKGGYDSVKAVESEEGGAVRVPEYVVYKLEQVHLGYMFEVRTGKAPSASASSSHNPSGGPSANS